jgi:SAM-dependent methyltransferase
MVASDRDWRAWGERDPYYAVLTDQRFHRETFAANREQFFATGEDFVAHWLGQLEEHFGPLRRTRALDFGCGVGRLTIPLADRFDATVAVDIAPAMIDEARRNSAGRDIVYLLSDDTLSRVEGSFDFVNSCIVLQHIPVRRGMTLLTRLLNLVRPGGGCLIQLSTKRNHGWWRELSYRVRHTMPGGQAAANLIAGRAADTPLMQMNEYSLDAVLPVFHQHGFPELLVRYEDHGGIDTALLLARRRP